MTYLKTQELYEVVTRMDKSATSFLYFILESNENIAFYSTLSFEKGQMYRDVIIKCTPELKSSLISILDHLKTKIEIQIVSESIVSDLN